MVLVAGILVIMLGALFVRWVCDRRAEWDNQ